MGYILTQGKAKIELSFFEAQNYVFAVYVQEEDGIENNQKEVMLAVSSTMSLTIENHGDKRKSMLLATDQIKLYSESISFFVKLYPSDEIVAIADCTKQETRVLYTDELISYIGVGK